MATSLNDWLESLAAKQATPGGGAAAGLAAATAAALVGMVSVYTTGEKWADREAEMQQIHEQAATLRERALQLMVDDEAAFAKVGEAYALSRESEDEKLARQAAIQKALTDAAEPPRQVAVVATEVIMLASALVTQGNVNVISDAAVAASFAKAAIEAAIVNIEVNQKLITDKVVQSTLAQAVSGCQEALTEADAVVTAVRKRIAG